MKNIENIIVILLACIVILINGQYVAEDKGGLMRYIPTYDKAGNKMGAHWWHPIYKLDQTPPPWQPWQKTSQTEFTDNRFNPEGMGIENFAHEALQTWPTPIVIGKPGHEEYPGKKIRFARTSSRRIDKAAPRCCWTGTSWPNTISKLQFAYGSHADA
jgi:hypothetical protein